MTNDDVREMGEQTIHLRVAAKAVRGRLAAWEQEDFVERLWRKDPTLWFNEPPPEIGDRLGWLDLPRTPQAELAKLSAFADELRHAQTKHVVLLGMGGSSLAPEVFARTFDNAPGCPALIVLDSTHPAAVRSLDQTVDLSATHFLVSSKSGTTTETMSLFRYFYAKAGGDAPGAGARFSALTEPQTPLEQLAIERNFRHVFRAPADVGGRYSALSQFGLVPAATIGMDVQQLLERARAFVETELYLPATKNSALHLGAALGELALHGRNKLTMVTSPSLAAFPEWLEQLVAESIGKDGKEIVPIVGEPPREPDAYASDRVFVYIHASTGHEDQTLRRLEHLAAAGHPIVEIKLRDMYDLGSEMFRWEMAIAAAGAVLGVHPFDQPDVELAKQQARTALQDNGRSVDIPAVATVRDGALSATLSEFCSSAGDGDYFAICAYLAPARSTTHILESIRLRLGQRYKIATTSGYGPRYLHSTGQMHKGGSNSGVFLQIVDETGSDVAVPEKDYTFGRLIHAQADGDYLALRARGRRVLRINVGRDVHAGLTQLVAALHSR